MRLVHRQREQKNSLVESEAYENSYGRHVLDHVDIVPIDSAEVHVEVGAEQGPEHHVTTEGLKRQFEQRLAARKRRRRL